MHKAERSTRLSPQTAEGTEKLRGVPTRRGELPSA